MASRRSARNAALKKDIAPNEEQDAPSDASPVESAEVAAPTRRKRKADGDSQSTKEQVEAFNSKRPKPKKLKKGSLQQVAQMPLDVLFEIFSKLNPIDLVHLSRTSKDLRSILMSKSSISIWKAARANIVGLPECLDGLAEPLYADLVFGPKSCNFCGKAPPKTVTCFRTSLRICAPCLMDSDVHSLHFSFSCDLFCDHWTNEKTKPLVEGDGALGSENDTFFTMWKAQQLLPTFKAYDFEELSWKGRPRKFSCSERYMTKTAIVWREQFVKLRTTKERQEWLEEKKAEKAARDDHAEAVKEFVTTYIGGLVTHKAATAEARLVMLAERAKLLGWTEEIELQNKDAVSILKENAIITKACMKDISVKGFKALEIEINRHFSQLKNDRILERHKNRLKETVDTLREIRARCVAERPMGEPQPTVGDLFHIDAVRNACIQYAQDPGALSVSPLQFVSDDFSLFREQWIEQCRRILLALLEKGEATSRNASNIENVKKVQPSDASLTPKPTTAVEGGAASVDGLQLATAFFQCQMCHTHLRFPNILMHECTRGAQVGCTGQRPSDWVVDALSSSNRRYEGRWNFHSHYSRGVITTAGDIQMANMLAVLEILSLDPATTTVDQLNDMNPIMECLSCNTLSKGRCVMDWAAVVDHSENLDFLGSNCAVKDNNKSCLENVPGNWALVEEEEVAIARKRIEEATEIRHSPSVTRWDRSSSEYKVLVCTVPQCGKQAGLMTLRQHIRQDHGRQPEKGDIILTPGTVDRHRHIYLWPPREDTSVNAMASSA